ncbi:Glucokinase regulator family [Mycena indigotica]|uniref:Glucokinase regulator family n=1 Tax=Mycena indigotica TaxID=2126181 RepID=A0A8H6TCD3_9AGAR|nr:Glucokinase regulator family [Mycena indigotica]KAF7316220.1 Glucokinase regulator family [Mycena indigotica]
MASSSSNWLNQVSTDAGLLPTPTTTPSPGRSPASPLQFLPNEPLLPELCTEKQNPASRDIDKMSTLEMCRIINAEDARVAGAVAEITPLIAEVVDRIAERMVEGGRLLYMGAGTSGRLGVLDLADIPPSYNADPMRYIALAAGGDITLRTARPAVEDSRAAGAADLGALLPTAQDTLVGISASGRTPYVLGALHSARAHGLLTIGLVCSENSVVAREGQCNFVLHPRVGPEIIAGSTRMKAGTATKMVLNMMSTSVQIKLGSTYSNLMVDVYPSNAKCSARARNIIRAIAGNLADAYSNDDLDGVISRCSGSVKLAVVVVVSGWGVPRCIDALERRAGSLRDVLEDVRYETVVRVFI